MRGRAQSALRVGWCHLGSLPTKGNATPLSELSPRDTPCREDELPWYGGGRRRTVGSQFRRLRHSGAVGRDLHGRVPEHLALVPRARQSALDARYAPGGCEPPTRGFGHTAPRTAQAPPPSVTLPSEAVCNRWRRSVVDVNRLRTGGHDAVKGDQQGRRARREAAGLERFWSGQTYGRRHGLDAASTLLLAAPWRHRLRHQACPTSSPRSLRSLAACRACGRRRAEAGAKGQAEEASPRRSGRGHAGDRRVGGGDWVRLRAERRRSNRGRSRALRRFARSSTPATGSCAAADSPSPRRPRPASSSRSRS